MVRITFERYISEVQKKWKANVWNLDVGEEKPNLFFSSEMRACGRGSKLFFLVTNRKYGEKIHLS